MTLYELCEEITLQGNIELKIFNQEGNEINSNFFHDETDFHISYTEHTNLEELPVSFIYPTKGYNGAVWLVIEVVKEDEDDII